MKALKALLPLIVCSLLLILLWRGLSLHPSEVPSPLVNQKLPEFTASDLLNPSKIASNQDFYSHVTLVNVWASWCYICAEEHAFLMELAKEHDIFIYGLNYKDTAADAKKWLDEKGNPYRVIAFDPEGKTGMEWGVYGAPETFLIDKKGMVRYKVIGALTREMWENKLKSLMLEMESEK